MLKNNFFDFANYELFILIKRRCRMAKGLKGKSIGAWAFLKYFP